MLRTIESPYFRSIYRSQAESAFVGAADRYRARTCTGNLRDSKSRQGTGTYGVQNVDLSFLTQIILIHNMVGLYFMSNLCIPSRLGQFEVKPMELCKLQFGIYFEHHCTNEP